MANQKEQNNLKLNIHPDVAKGTYANLVVVSHTPAEIVLDFKRLLAALNDNLKKYEQQFGPIVEPTPDGTVPYDILGKA